MLFRKNIDPRCAYCAKGSRINDEQVVCVKLQKHRDGALNAHILDRERLVVVGETQQYVADAALKVGEVGRQADNSHQL